MRRRSCFALITLAAVGLTGLIVTLVRQDPCPVTLEVASKEPSGMLDDDGTEAWLANVKMVNLGAHPLYFNGLKVRAKVRDTWVDGIGFGVSDLRPGATNEIQLVLPFAAHDVRVQLEYLSEPLSLRFTRFCGRLGLFEVRRLRAWKWFPAGWIAPLRRDEIRGRKWKETSKPLPLPQASPTHKETMHRLTEVVNPDPCRL